MGRKAQWPPPVYPHPSGNDRMRVYISGKPKDIWLGPTGSPESKRRYIEEVARIEANGGHYMPPAEPTDTIAQLIAHWTAHAEQRYDPESREPQEYRSALGPLLEMFGATPAASFGPKQLKTLQAAMGKRWSRKVANRHVVRVRTMFRWAESEELVPAGTTFRLATVQAIAEGTPGVTDHEPVQPCEWDTLRAVVRKAAPQVKAILLLCWWSGMRPGEACRLTTAQIDRTGDVWIYAPHKHKTKKRGKYRIIPLGPKSQAVLRRWLQPDNPDAFIFPPVRRRKYPCYNHNHFGQAVRRAAERAGVTLHAYQCRHAARERWGNAAGLEAARQQLGHASVSTTLLYARGQVAGAIEAARKLA